MIAPIPPVGDDDVASVALGPLTLEELAGLHALTIEERNRLEEWLRADVELALSCSAAGVLA